ncbi:MAG: GxxExxY protein [Rhodocyclaceae bacterium]|nr:MAG: GxxExxY protein [Rhodocyclaceae bacterium]
MHQGIDESLDALAKEVVDAVFQVHTALGPGLLESAYETCLAIELRRRQIPFHTQKPLSIVYRDVTVESAFRADLIVGDRLLLELKSVDSLLPLHQAQVLTYLRLTGLSLGLLINFNTPKIKDGIKRLAL